MDSPWFILSGRYGDDTPAPSVERLHCALAEVYVENHPARTQADYEEHPSSFVRYRTDCGSMYVIDVNRSHSVRFERWADQDYGDELARALTIDGVSCEEALGMCFWAEYARTVEPRLAQPLVHLNFSRKIRIAPFTSLARSEGWLTGFIADIHSP